MSSITTTIIKCDIKDCGKENSKTVRLQVIFTSNQTDGSSCPPYLEAVNIDLCDQCLSRVLKGEYIFAYGGQGFNTYYFKEDK